MPERPLETLDFKMPKPQTILILIVLLILFIVSWGSFALVPAGHMGVVLLWGSVEKRIMGEGLNFKVPITEKVIKVDVKVQPHPFKEIDASSREYQNVRKWNGILPQVSGGAVPFLDLGKMGGLSGGA